MNNRIPEEILNRIGNIIVPSLIAAIISVATQIKNKTANWLPTSLSVIIGICMAYLFGDLILSYFSSKTAPIVIAGITICGEKISYWLLYKFNFDTIGDAIVKAIKSKLK